jgi:lipopolysaccharide transport system ATP-binding protein
VAKPIVIQAEKISKAYQLGKQNSMSLRELFSSKGSSNSRETFQALKEVSFEVEQGTVLGIVGRNGAGKSTLLKVLSRITRPDTGHVSMTGRVSSILEVGTGFHPELSGRENIYLNGTILGMKRQEIKSRFDEIVAFSGVSRFIDTPVKYYSSGMYVRLAFAVAAHLETEILIIDEVLAVGDAEFQKKCLGKMGEVSRDQGRTVLFVSHNMSAVSGLCTKAMLLNSGQLEFTGDTSQVIQRYLQSGKSSESVYRASGMPDKPCLMEAKVLTSAPQAVTFNGQALELEFTLYTPHPVGAASFSFQIVDETEGKVVHAWVFDSEQAFFRKEGTYLLRCKIPQLKLYMGSYSLFTYLGSSRDKELLESLEGICPFQVEMHDQFREEYQWQPGSCKYTETFSWEISEL